MQRSQHPLKKITLLLTSLISIIFNIACDDIEDMTSDISATQYEISSSHNEPKHCYSDPDEEMYHNLSSIESSFSFQLRTYLP